jgi:phenazine biosynthesis protein phzE
MNGYRRDLLDRVLDLEPASFALLHRRGSGPEEALDVLVGDLGTPATLAGIPLGPTGAPEHGPAQDVLVVLPYRQITERGFTAPDDGTPLLAMSVTEHQRLPLAQALARVPDLPAAVNGGRFEPDDDEYAALVRRVIDEEIGTGEGANFVIKRSFTAEIGDWSPKLALSFFRRLLEREQGAYWTFVIHAGGRTLVGASPERHITLDDGLAVMNPISGTYRYPASGPTLQGVTDFLADRKEADELYMVVDEELKMMARICDHGGTVVGPYLKQMARLAHTEYFIEGRTTRDVREILRETMFAPTVTGSPLESAARVIDRHEPEGRGYYSGAAALIGRDAAGRPTLDSAILIRTADIDPGGRVRIGVGATLVRHSDPDSEVAETRAKAAGLLQALEAGGASTLADHPTVLAALRRRNAGIADFWLRDAVTRQQADPELTGLKALVVDAEDTFTAMIDHQLRSLGLAVQVQRFDEPYDFDGYDLVVMGPGPGNPCADGDPKVARLRRTLDALLAARKPFLAVCLSHQVLSRRIGLEIVRRRVPNQGVQRGIDLFGGAERVGFYNTFAAYSSEDTRELLGVGPVLVSRDGEDGQVHALRGPFFASMQFHPESVLTVEGPRIVAEALRHLLRADEGTGVPQRVSA